MINVLIVEDNEIVSSGLYNVFSEKDGFAVCGQAKNGLEALNLVRNGLNVDVVVADVNMPVMDGFEFTDILKNEYPLLPVVIHTMHDKVAFEERALLTGAKGYVLKSVDVNELFDAILTVSEGGVYFPKR